jgi:hypothetical protein
MGAQPPKKIHVAALAAMDQARDDVSQGESDP